MKFVYKIYSGYSGPGGGFTPSKIAARFEGSDLRLGWERYLQAIELGDEIWVYFYGPHRFTPGVYVKGIAKEILLDKSQVLIRVSEWHDSVPLTDADLS